MLKLIRRFNQAKLQIKHLSINLGKSIINRIFILFYNSLKKRISFLNIWGNNDKNHMKFISKSLKSLAHLFLVILHIDREGRSGTSRLVLSREIRPRYQST